MRRPGIFVALCIMLGTLAGVVTASPALAGRGHKWQVVDAGPFTLPASLCGFKVRVKPVSKEYVKMLKASDGSMISLLTGALRFSYTNLSTGKAITENVSGPGKFTVHADGSATSVALGHTAQFLLPADAQRFGFPTINVTTGRLVTNADAAGNITSLTLHGHVAVDVCAALS